MKRVILIVMDSLGVGQLEDAAKYGDEGGNTFGTIFKNNKNIKIPSLKKLGFCNIDNMPCNGIDNPQGSFGKAKEMSVGKDTITGHFEITGLLTKDPFKTYPNGFPDEFINAFQEKIGQKVLGNYPASGTVIIEELGPQHEKTGEPIVYTSADSVFQIAANIDVMPLSRLYEICQIARDLLVGKWACGRVIARPYRIINGKRERTSDRHDYAVTPPEDTILNKIQKANMEVYAIGKINDIFNGSGITRQVHTNDNMDGVNKTITAIKEEFEGLIFTNLVDFDSKFGHRRDISGYGHAIEEFDSRINEIQSEMKEDDILILCADHGNDPGFKGFDHTREYIPVIVFGSNIKKGINIHERETFGDIGATIVDYLGIKGTNLGISFLNQIKK